MDRPWFTPGPRELSRDLRTAAAPGHSSPRSGDHGGHLLGACTWNLRMSRGLPAFFKQF